MNNFVFEQDGLNGICSMFGVDTEQEFAKLDASNFKEYERIYIYETNKVYVVLSNDNSLEKMWSQGAAESNSVNTHICKYCGGTAKGSYEDLLCYECRECFGHSLYSEL